MRLIKFLKNLFASANSTIAESYETYSDHTNCEIVEVDGRFRICFGTVTFGSFGCYEDARRVAEDYNFLEIKKPISED